MREVAPVKGQRHAGDFPVAGDRVLAARDFTGDAVLADELCISQRVASRRQSGCTAQPQRAHVRHVERHAITDMAQRIGSFITEARGIGRTADAEGIEDQEKGSCHCVSASTRDARQHRCRLTRTLAWNVSTFYQGCSPLE